MRRLFLIALLTVSSQLIADEGVIVRTATLRASTSYIAKTISNLVPGTEVKLLERKGGWQKVVVLQKPHSKPAIAPKSTKNEGWVRGYQVRTNIRRQAGGAVALSRKEGGVLTGLSSLSKSTSSLFGGSKKPKQQNTVVATIGVRGLSEQDLANAKPDAFEFDILKQYAASDKQAKAFAKKAKLKKYKVSELENPDKKKKRKKKRKKKSRKDKD